MFDKLKKRIWSRYHRAFPGNPDAFLKDSRGILHIGANHGQERIEYAAAGLPVIWIEPIPAVFEALRENLRPFPHQKAFRYLVTDQDGATYDFHVASNGGASSSILELAQHTSIWPDVTYTSSVKLESITLTSLVAQEKIDVGLFDALVLDTQGSELLVLRGGLGVLRRFRYVKLEAADFESYRGCCTVEELTSFMREQGFAEIHRHPFVEKVEGSYYDIVYRNKHPATRAAS